MCQCTRSSYARWCIALLFHSDCANTRIKRTKMQRKKMKRKKICLPLFKTLNYKSNFLWQLAERHERKSVCNFFPLIHFHIFVFVCFIHLLLCCKFILFAGSDGRALPRSMRMLKYKFMQIFSEAVKFNRMIEYQCEHKLLIHKTDFISFSFFHQIFNCGSTTCLDAYGWVSIFRSKPIFFLLSFFLFSLLPHTRHTPHEVRNCERKLNNVTFL